VKFLCDRCKTRYSIGDDRVRGKILKIRCKNCANVITVREGMTADDVAASDRNRPTTAAPLNDPAPANGALASAFANQLTKPPPALEEEWYVSIDGEQTGPYSLADAQKWVGGKAWDADLHCWSEGFDDWLTVVIDDYSRAIAGYYLSFDAPCALHTSLALRQAIWRKEDPRWHVCGIPETFYTDHGTDFTSQHLEQVSADLKMALVFSTVGRPRGRGRPGPGPGF